MHKMMILDRTGHTTVEWIPTDEAAIKAATEAFNAAIQNGLAYKVEGKTREMIREFDATATEIIITPQLVGGK